MARGIPIGWSTPAFGDRFTSPPGPWEVKRIGFMAASYAVADYDCGSEHPTVHLQARYKSLTAKREGLAALSGSAGGPILMAMNSGSYGPALTTRQDFPAPLSRR